MIPYLRWLKTPSRRLRRQMTEAERALWRRLRRKQLDGLQFYRQKPLLRFIVDFYCPAAKLVIEVDGMHHRQPEYRAKDRVRDAALAEIGLRVLRFDNRQVLRQPDRVLEAIRWAAGEAARGSLSPPPPAPAPAPARGGAAANRHRPRPGGAGRSRSSAAARRRR
jgi:very-short-patch-repair endonuclease